MSYHMDEIENDSDDERAENDRFGDEQRRTEDRRLEYLDAGLEQPDPADAIMQVVNSRLVDLNAYAYGVVKQVIDERGTSTEGFAQAKPMLDAAIKSASMIERFMTFAERQKQQTPRQQSSTFRPPHSR